MSMDEAEQAATAVTPRVIAGLDGSESDRAVVDWAGDEAVRSGVPLELICVVEVAREFAAPDLLAFGTEVDSSLGGSARDVVNQAREAVLARHPDLPVRVSSPFGRPAGELVEASTDASAVVVGATTRTGLERVLLGSVALTVVEHAACPVVVIPSASQVGRLQRIVVGIDGEPSRDAAEYALRVAAAADASVTFLVSWHLAVVDGVVVTEPGTPKWTAVEDGHRDRVQQVIEPLLERYPDVPTHIDVVHAPTLKAIIAAGADADLLVLGTRGRGGFRGLLLGSVTKRVLEHAGSPVAVVR